MTRSAVALEPQTKFEDQKGRGTLGSVASRVATRYDSRQAEKVATVLIQDDSNASILKSTTGLIGDSMKKIGGSSSMVSTWGRTAR